MLLPLVEFGINSPLTYKSNLNIPIVNMYINQDLYDIYHLNDGTNINLYYSTTVGSSVYNYHHFTTDLSGTFNVTDSLYIGTKSIKITNSKVTNSTSYKLIPTNSFISYAGSNGSSTMENWNDSNQTWITNYGNNGNSTNLKIYTTSTGLYIYTTFDIGTAGMCYGGRLQINGDGNIYMLGRIHLEFDESII